MLLFLLLLLLLLFWFLLDIEENFFWKLELVSNTKGNQYLYTDAFQ